MQSWEEEEREEGEGVGGDHLEADMLVRLVGELEGARDLLLQFDFFHTKQEIKSRPTRGIKISDPQRKRRIR